MKEREEWARKSIVFIVIRKLHIGKDQISKHGIVKIVWGRENNDLFRRMDIIQYSYD